jgi:hypothetical protein
MEWAAGAGRLIDCADIGPARSPDSPSMWEAQIACSECDATHQVHAELKPRAFSFECPATGAAVNLPFHDPSRLVSEWREVDCLGPGSIPASTAETRGKFEL